MEVGLVGASGEKRLVSDLGESGRREEGLLPLLWLASSCPISPGPGAGGLLPTAPPPALPDVLFNIAAK